MLFEKMILTEAPGDDPRSFRQQHSVSRVDDIPLPDDVLDDIAEGKWEEGYSKLTNAKDIDIFLDAFLNSYPGFTSFKDRIEVIKAPLKRELMNLGNKAFNPETNPILTFLTTYFSLSSDNKFTEDQFKGLLSMWYEGIIDNKDLKKKGPADHIIFNKNLYGMTDNTFIVQAYGWLSKESNVKEYVDITKPDDKRMIYIRDVIMHPGAGRDDSGKFTTSTMRFKNIKDFRNFIIYVDKDRPEGDINTAAEIQRRLGALQDAKKPTEDKPEEGSVKMRPIRYEKSDIDKILSGGLEGFSKTYVNTLLNYFKDMGWI